MIDTDVFLTSIRDDMATMWKHEQVPNPMDPCGPMPLLQRRAVPAEYIMWISILQAIVCIKKNGRDQNAEGLTNVIRVLKRRCVFILRRPWLISSRPRTKEAIIDRLERYVDAPNLRLKRRSRQDEFKETVLKPLIEEMSMC